MKLKFKIDTWSPIWTYCYRVKYIDHVSNLNFSATKLQSSIENALKFEFHAYAITWQISREDFLHWNLIPPVLTADAYISRRMKIGFKKRADLVNGIWGDKIHTQSTVWRVIAFEIWIWNPNRGNTLPKNRHKWENQDYQTYRPLVDRGSVM